MELYKKINIIFNKHHSKLNNLFSILIICLYALEIFFYSGVFKAKTGFSITVITQSILVAYFFITYRFYKLKISLEFIKYIGIALFFLFLYYFFYIIEGWNYKNYVLQNFNIDFRPIKDLSFFFIFYLLFHYLGFFIQNNLVAFKDLKKIVVYFLIIFMSIEITLIDFTKNLNIVIINTQLILKNLQKSQNEKLAFFWEETTSVMNLVKYGTDETSTIAIPPQNSPWDEEGNKYIVNYFIYPRKIAQNNKGNFLLPNERFDYILISRGNSTALNENDYGWPKQKFSYQSLILFNKDTQEYSINNQPGKFDPELFNWDQYPFGIAKYQE